MDSNIKKDLENELQLIKPIIEGFRSFPNDTNEITPIIKYLKNFSTINYNIEDNTHVIKKSNTLIKLPANPKLRNSLKSDIHSDTNNNLTINNNTNLTNLNLYFLYNTEKKQPIMKELKPRNTKSVKKREPTDTNKKKYFYKKIGLNEKYEVDKINTQNTKKNYSIKYSIKKVNSKSPNNNDHFLKKKAGEKIAKIEQKREKTPKDVNIKIKNKDKIINEKKQDIISKKEEPTGLLNLSEFLRINQLGKGTFGKIYSVEWKKNGKKYALKKETFNDLEFLKKRKDIVKIIKDFLQKTKSNGVINIYSSLCQKKEKEYNYYELMELGERDWEQEIILRRKQGLYYTEKEIFDITKELVGTLSLLQKNHITHRDIKHQNILIINGHYKLCDFGEIRMMKGKGLVVQRIRGSELFMSPILFYGLRANLIQVKHNTYKSDVFSLGMCLLYAATMHFDGTDEIREMFDMNMIRLTLEKYLKERYSKKFISLLCCMLETNEDLRPDFEQLEEKIDNLLIV